MNDDILLSLSASWAFLVVRSVVVIFICVIRHLRLDTIRDINYNLKVRFCFKISVQNIEPRYLCFS